MDEPTSGLDARAAAIVMRTVTVDTGRTVVSITDEERRTSHLCRSPWLRVSQAHRIL